jgi:5'-nucleotidase/UDP-sugar diphosphatase
MTDSRQNPRRAATLLLALLLPALVLVACGGPRRATVTILHTNDQHAHHRREGRSLGAAEVAGAIEREREARGSVLVLDAGDLVAGTAASSLSKGLVPFSIAGRMGYDAMALGNHELDHGWRRIAAYREVAPFPLLCANAFAPDGSLLADATHVILPVGDVRVGVVGVLEEAALLHTVRAGNEGVRVEPPEKALREIVPVLREEVDLLVVLSHCGLEIDRRLARTVAGIDVIVGGHSHDALERPERVGDTWIAHAGSYLRALGRLEVVLDLDRGHVLAVRGELLRPAGPKHPDVAAAVQDVERELAPRLDRVIGTAERALSRAELRAAIERVYRERLGAELAFQNPGGVRRDLPAGPITVRRVWRILPFENTLGVLRVPGSRLPPEWCGDAEIDPERVYTVATNSYVAERQERWLEGPAIPFEDRGLGMREVVLEAVELGTFAP